jgi:hypothetical protein
VNLSLEKQPVWQSLQIFSISGHAKHAGLNMLRRLLRVSKYEKRETWNFSLAPTRGDPTNALESQHMFVHFDLTTRFSHHDRNEQFRKKKGRQE